MIRSLAELFGFSKAGRPVEDHGFFCLVRAVDHSLVLVRPEVNTVQREQVDSVVNTIGKLGDLPCIIDISQLDDLSSDVVTALVRAWKRIRTSGGEMAVVTTSQRALGVLETAQLSSIWNIADTHETAADQLGISEAARMEARERRLLVLVAPWAILTAILTVCLQFVPGMETRAILPQITVALCGLAFLCAGVSLFREHGFQRAASAVLAVMAVLLGSWVTLQNWYPDDLATLKSLVPFTSHSEVTEPTVSEEAGDFPANEMSVDPEPSTDASDPGDVTENTVNDDGDDEKQKNDPEHAALKSNSPVPMITEKGEEQGDGTPAKKSNKKRDAENGIETIKSKSSDGA